MDIRSATRSYESWLARQTDVVLGDLRLKHARMRESAFVFLRGTFYRWMTEWPIVCADLADAPRVCAVGDLHLENFGTWRDAEGRLIWGVNDLDEACVLPYTQDLVRLATSAVLATRANHLALSRRAACDAILDGYVASLDRGGRAHVLAERQRWLRALAENDLRDPARFWTNLQALAPAKRGVPHRVLRSSLPDPKLSYRVVRRIAGVGSLGRPRFVALAEWGGALIAREAKARVPSAAVWATGADRSSARHADAASTLLAHGARASDPYFWIRDGWIVRRLAPDCARIELSELPKRRDEAKLLRAMGWETANLHLAAGARHIGRDLRGRPSRWLRTAAGAMAESVERDWRNWTRAR
jgi:hypothetical protein